MSDASPKISIRIEIDIPVGTAAETVKSLQQVLRNGLLEQSTQAPQSVQPSETSRKQMREIERSELDRKKQEFFALAPLAYRIYRKIRPVSKTAYQAHKFIAEKLHLDHPIGAEVLVKKHKKKLNAYIRQRREKTALRLAYARWSNAEIAAHLNISIRMVSRLITAARASQNRRLK